jgi:hypothetical protein
MAPRVLRTWWSRFDSGQQVASLRGLTEWLAVSAEYPFAHATSSIQSSPSNPVCQTPTRSPRSSQFGWSEPIASLRYALRCHPSMNSSLAWCERAVQQAGVPTRPPSRAHKAKSRLRDCVFEGSGCAVSLGLRALPCICRLLRGPSEIVALALGPGPRRFSHSPAVGLGLVRLTRKGRTLSRPSSPALSSGPGNV